MGALVVIVIVIVWSEIGTAPGIIVLVMFLTSCIVVGLAMSSVDSPAKSFAVASLSAPASIVSGFITGFVIKFGYNIKNKKHKKKHKRKSKKKKQ